ncbi:MAG TPA: hypothetical protein VNF47_14770 [Streptosporangiaceae bacterium]|nr:hypothetical protein [Streptosporangiaceae bacterium]
MTKRTGPPGTAAASPGTIRLAGTGAGTARSSPTRPGLHRRRLARLASEAVERCQLDLSGRTVLTEAATGAYEVTAVLAALAGACVYALARPTRYASSAELKSGTAELAKLAGVSGQIELVTDKSAEVIGAADIVTNSGQVRPIDADMVPLLKPSAVIPLMYESWEFRHQDLDLEACRSHGIIVAGTSETHPAVDVFSFLGPMAVKQLHDAGIAVYGSKIFVLCDNAFAPFIARYLRQSGAAAAAHATLTAACLRERWDAVLLALHPRAEPVLTAADARLLADQAPGAVLVQYWGDADRAALAAADVPVWPPQVPAPGHMGVLPCAVGPEAVVRLQAGGLKVGEVLANGLHQATAADLAFVQIL